MGVVAVAREGEVEIFPSSSFQVPTHHYIGRGLGSLLIILNNILPTILYGRWDCIIQLYRQVAGYIVVERSIQY